MRTQIVNRTQRAKIVARPDPYWHLIAEGQHLGYRKSGKSAGTWIARLYNAETKKRSWEALGQADDNVEANGAGVLSFSQAVEAALAWMKRTSRALGANVQVGKYTVADAASDWLATWTGTDRGKETAVANIDLHILPTLGNVMLEKLTRSQIERWLHDQSKKPPIKVLRRSTGEKKLPPSRQSKLVYDSNDPETQRRRKDSANRVFRDLRALLNRAYENRRVGSKAAWETVKEFENVGKSKNEYLTLEEAGRFLRACPLDFRLLAQAALITGCRYGELCKLVSSSFDAHLGAITFIQGKTGKLKRVFLTDEEAAFVKLCTRGKRPDELIFLRDDGLPWGKSHQQQRMKMTLKAANIQRRVRFHDLRHTFATLLAMNGTALPLIAHQLGHTGTRMVEEHYAHFSPSYVAATVRALKPTYSLD